MGRVEVDPQRVGLAGAALQPEGLGRTIRAGSDLHRQGRNGDDAPVLHADVQLRVLAALDGVFRQISADGEGIRRPAHPQEPGQHQGEHHHRGPQEQGVPRGERRHQQRAAHRQRQADAHLEGLLRVRLHHSFTGTGLFLSTRSTTLWEVTPFMRLSGLSTRRWESTGSAICCTSSGRM